jgi:hypothetical protein
VSDYSIKFDAFLASLEGKTFIDVHKATQQECYEVDGRKRAVKKKDPRRHDVDEYGRLVTGLAFWIQSGIKPYGMSFDEFLKLRPLCERFIAEGALKPAALDPFGPSAP